MNNTFVENAWYVIAWSEDLPAMSSVSRTVLGQSIVAFRSEDGLASAVADRCPHRGVPLSMGQVAANHIRCPYHALEFNGAGVCVRNPHIKADPGRLTVRSYPVVERHGAVWVWTGSPASADPALVPDYGWFGPDVPGYRTIRGDLRVEADFRLVIDNLLDLSHAEYLHANTVGTVGASGSAETSVDVGDQRVTVLRKIFDLAPSAVFKSAWHKSERIDQQSNMTWRAPSHLLLDLGIMPAGGALSEGLHFPSAHLLTPETDRTTHYFYAISPSFLLEDDAFDDKVRGSILQAFGNEDRPIVEAIQRNAVDTADGFKFSDFTTGDAAASRVRRMLEKLSAQPADT